MGHVLGSGQRPTSNLWKPPSASESKTQQLLAWNVWMKRFSLCFRRTLETANVCNAQDSHIIWEEGGEGSMLMTWKRSSWVRSVPASTVILWGGSFGSTLKHLALLLLLCYQTASRWLRQNWKIDLLLNKHTLTRLMKKKSIFKSKKSNRRSHLCLKRNDVLTEL